MLGNPCLLGENKNNLQIFKLLFLPKEIALAKQVQHATLIRRFCVYIALFN